jgi:hypothetical protein
VFPSETLDVWILSRHRHQNERHASRLGGTSRRPSVQICRDDGAIHDQSVQSATPISCERLIGIHRSNRVPPGADRSSYEIAVALIAMRYDDLFGVLCGFVDASG